MITDFKKILFFADGAKGEGPALRLCYRLAKHNEAQLLILGVVDEVLTDDLQLRATLGRIQKAMIQERRNEINELIDLALSAEEQKNISIEVVAGKDHVEVIEKSIRGGFDVIIKAAETSASVRQAIFGTTDARLLHAAACPVMILRPKRRQGLRNVLLAVDPLVSTEQESSLNTALLGMAASIAEVESANLHLLHVLENPLSGQKGKHKAEFVDMGKRLQADAERRLQDLTGSFIGLEPLVTLKSGRPHAVITKFVEQHDVDMLVMGSVGRSGLSGFVVGNTAEKILNQVDASVLVMKPKGWLNASSGP